MVSVSPIGLFDSLGGRDIEGLPSIDSVVYRTPLGNSYFQAPAVVMLSRPAVSLGGMRGFLESFPREFQYPDYLEDPGQLSSGSLLCKTAGQICYLSLGAARTHNDKADLYFKNIKSSGHGSVLEHAVYSFLLYGVSRSFTHELVRHRVGTAYSQTSQRYVGSGTLRFVERPEYVNNQELHLSFLEHVDDVALRYQQRIQTLSDSQDESSAKDPGQKREVRKRIQQAARSLLTNDVEAPIVFSANIRALRHIIELRVSDAAEPEMRQVVLRLLVCLARVEPLLFSDYTLIELGDGTFRASTEFKKI